jgi:hypothetical protein
LTEEYTVNVVLPLGATNIKVDVPVDAEITTDGLNFGTLDYYGAPVITVKTKNANSMTSRGDLVVTYTYSPAQLVLKPLYLSSIVFGLLIALIFVSRVPLSIQDD